MKNQLRLLLCCLVLVVVLPACEKDEPLVPHFFVTYSGKTVTFNNTTLGTKDTPKDQIQSVWDFGNGQTSTQDSPVYTYPAAGVFTVKLTVKNVAGKEYSITGDVAPK
jgi:hypothetical protein